MQKNFIIAFFIISLLLALFLTVISLGWFMIIFGLIAAVVIILHVTGGVLSFKTLPRSATLLVLSSGCLIILALLKYDFDDVGAYTGLSQLKFLLGFTERPYIEIGQVHHFIFIALLIAQIVMDFFLIRNFGWKRKKKVV